MLATNNLSYETVFLEVGVLYTDFCKALAPTVQ
jgi:hypothetical protein